MIWVVVDTNTLVSGLGWPGGPPSRVVQHIVEGRLLLVTSRPLLEELAEVLQYRKFHGVFDDPLSLALLIETVAVVVEPSVTVDVLADEPDNRLLEAAQAGHADYIISGDQGVLELRYFEGSQIVSASAFIRALESGEGP